MHWLCQSARAVAIATATAPLSLAQESLCSPCVDPPVRHEIDHSDTSPISIISVIDLINQLPQKVAEETSSRQEESAGDSDDPDAAADVPGSTDEWGSAISGRLTPSLFAALIIE